MAKTEEKNTSGKRWYKITRSGAQHRGKRDGKWVTFGSGPGLAAEIDLTDEQVAGGAYSHLGLVPLVGTPNRAPVREVDGLPASAANPNKNVRQVPATGTGVSDGEKDENTELVIGDGTGTEPADDGKNADDTGPSKQKVTAALNAVKKASRANEVAAAREKVIALDIFEEDSVPTKKAELIKALEDYQAEQE